MLNEWISEKGFAKGFANPFASTCFCKDDVIPKVLGALYASSLLVVFFLTTGFSLSPLISV